MKRLFLFSIVILGLVFAAPGYGYYYKATELRSTTYDEPYYVGPGTIFAGDINGDGFWDAVVTSAVFPPEPPGSIEIRILINDGNGLFSDETNAIISGSVPATTNALVTFFADFNGDNRTDIFLSSHGYDSPEVPGEPNMLLLSTADGHLVDASSNLPGYSDFTHPAAIGDIDGDGDIDIYVGNRHLVPDLPYDLLTYFLMNDGSGVFTVNTSRLPASMTELDGFRQDTAAAIADMNGDGHVDFISGAASEPGNVHSSTIFYNDGAGNFSDDRKRDLPYGAFGENHSIEDIVPIDLNDDGRLDLILSQLPINGLPGYCIQILMQESDGLFTDESNLRIANDMAYNPDGGCVAGLIPIDFDGDGDLDIYLKDVGWYDNPDTPVLLLNDGTGHFTMVTRQAFDGFDPNLFIWDYPIPTGHGGLVNLLLMRNDQNTLYFQTFKEDTTPPTVSSTAPANNATSVAVNTTISATFSEDMDASSVTTATFLVNDGSSNIAGTLTYSGTTATFTPTTDLDYDTTYIGTITIGVKDLAGNALETDYTWSFTTESETPTDGEPPSDGEEDTGGGGGVGCFIATAAYGSRVAKEVVVLRNFRDRVLLRNSLGRSFVEFYYKVSPPFSDYIEKYEVLKTGARLILTPIVDGVKYPKTSVLILLSAIIAITLTLRVRRSNRF